MSSLLTGIMGGSFNPVHLGHLMVAGYIREFTPIDEVWLTLSPRNPLKARASELIPDLKRLEMLNIAIEGMEGISVCDVELSMPRPSYTADTLRLLSKRYPSRRFKLIIGSDNWRIFEQWKDAEEILSDFGVLIYPRPGYPIGNLYVDGAEVVEAPRCSLSSTFIREGIARGRNMNYFLPPGVYDYIIKNRIYKSNSI